MTQRSVAVFSLPSTDIEEFALNPPAFQALETAPFTADGLSGLRERDAAFSEQICAPRT